MTRMLTAIALLLALGGGAWADEACPGVAGDVHRVEGTDNTANDFRENGIYDATGQTFTFDSNVVRYPIDVRAAAWCWKGGAVRRTNAHSETWTDAKHPNNTGIFAVGRAVIDGTRFDNTHDAIRPARGASEFWTVRNVWVSWNRDDCIENDWFASGLVEDSLFDGCYVFLSSRNKGVYASAQVTVRNSLIHLQDMPGPYGHNDPSVRGHGPLFKYKSDSPDLVLKDNVFLIDSCASTKHKIADCSRPELIGFLPRKKLKECSGNVIVWGGPGRFPGKIPNDPSCVTVTTDRAVWDRARDAWLAAHPQVMRISGVDDPAAGRVVEKTVAAPAPAIPADAAGNVGEPQAAIDRACATANCAE